MCFKTVCSKEKSYCENYDKQVTDIEDIDVSKISNSLHEIQVKLLLILVSLFSSFLMSFPFRSPFILPTLDPLSSPIQLHFAPIWGSVSSATTWLPLFSVLTAQHTNKPLIAAGITSK